MNRTLLWACVMTLLGATAPALARSPNGAELPSREQLRALYVAKSWSDTKVLCNPGQRAAARASAFGCYHGYGKPGYSEFIRTSIYVPVRDGTRLAVDIYRPSIDGKPVEGRFPVAFTYSRYWRAETRPDGTISTSAGILDKGQNSANIDAAMKRANGRGAAVGLLLSHGYIFVRAEARGSGVSFGVRNGDMSGIEALDGRDLIDWIARQPWSDGKVGMLGGSYEGMSQHLVASTAPKPLRAIFPMVATFDEYHSSWSGTGILKKYGLAWLARQAKRDGVQQGKQGSVINPDDANAVQDPPVDADSDGSIRSAARKERLGDPEAVDPMSYFTRQSKEAGEMVRLISAALGTSSPVDLMEALYSPRILADLARRTPGLRERLTALHFYRDASDMLIRPQDTGPNNLAMLAPRISASGVGVYNWGGWRDFATIDTLLWDANLTNPRKLAMGPWTHGPNEKDDMREEASRVLSPIEQLRWLDYWLKGIDNGIMREPSTTFAVMGQGDRFYWQHASRFPGAQMVRKPWLVGPDGTLGGGGSRSGSAAFTVDNAGGLGDHTRYHDAIGLGPYRWPDLEQHARQGAVAFTSTPLTAPVQLRGSPVARLYVRSSTPDAYLHGYLERVNADGSIELLADGAMRASHRTLGKPVYNNLGNPFSDSRKRIVDATPPLRADRPALVTFELQPIAALLEKGTRIRFVVAGAEAGTNLSIEQDPATRLTVDFGPSAATALVLPVVTAR